MVLCVCLPPKRNLNLETENRNCNSARQLLTLCYKRQHQSGGGVSQVSKYCHIWAFKLENSFWSAKFLSIHLRIHKAFTYREKIVCSAQWAGQSPFSTRLTKRCKQAIHFKTDSPRWKKALPETFHFIIMQKQYTLSSKLPSIFEFLSFPRLALTYQIHSCDAWRFPVSPSITRGNPKLAVYCVAKTECWVG